MNLEIRKKEIAERLNEIRALAEKEDNLSVLEKLEKENIDLKKENTELSVKTNELQKQLSAYRTLKDKFVEKRGALFKRRPEGGYHETVFCLSCQSPLSSFGGDFPYSCDRCQIHLDFSLNDLPGIIESLPE